MKVRRLIIERFRGHEQLEWYPRAINLLIGSNAAGKSTILEALDILFDPGWGRPRPAPRREDYWRRAVATGFRIEALLGELSEADLADFQDNLEGWMASDRRLVADPDGPGIETVVRVEVHGTPDLDLEYRMAKPETGDSPFSPRLRRRVNFVYDGRSRDPARQLAFYQGSVLERVFGDVDLTAPLRLLADRLGEGEQAVNDDPSVTEVLQRIRVSLSEVGIGASPDGGPLLSVGGLSDRELLQALSLALRHDADFTLPVARQGRGLQRLALVGFLLVLAGRAQNRPIAAFEEPEEALEPFRARLLVQQLRAVAAAGGQILATTHSPDVLGCFRPDEIVIVNPTGSAERLVDLAARLPPPTRYYLERHMDGPLSAALFAPVAFLVDGPSERAAIPVFWNHLSTTDGLPTPELLGVQLVNCEGTPTMPGIAEALRRTARRIIILFDRDLDSDRVAERTRAMAHAHAWILHRTGTPDIEAVFAAELPLQALGAGLTAIADDRQFTWEIARAALVARLPPETLPQQREAANTAEHWPALVAAVEEAALRSAVRQALRSGPLDAKGGRPGRLLAQAAIGQAAIPVSIQRIIRTVIAAVRENRELNVDLDDPPDAHGI